MYSQLYSTKMIFNWSSKTILIAEDVESNFLYLEEVIKQTGAQILWAKNGIKAVEMFQQHKVDLVLMDIQMPLMNGFDATKAIKRKPQMFPLFLKRLMQWLKIEQKVWKQVVMTILPNQFQVRIY